MAAHNVAARNLIALLGAALVTVGAARPAVAQEGGATDIETLDLTMELMPAGARGPEAVTRVIELPDSAVEAARRNAARGLDRANENRAGRDAPGLDVAAEARERGLEQAQQDRENAGRGRPDTAGRPDGPGPPDGVPNGPRDNPGPPDGVPNGPPDTPGPPDGVPNGPPDNPGPPDGVPNGPPETPGPPN